MKRLVLPLLLLGACASPAPVPPAEVGFARVLLERERAVAAPSQPDLASAADAVELQPSAAELPPARTLADAIVSVLGEAAARVRDLTPTARDDARLDALLQTPISRDDLVALAVLRAPAVREAWAKYEAARTAYSQSAELSDLVALYRSFVRDVQTGVGPERGRRPTGTIAPAPNLDGLSAEIARRNVGVAFEGVRMAVRDVAAQAIRLHADAVHLAGSLVVLDHEVKIVEAEFDSLRARLEAGRLDQAGYLAFEGRLASLRVRRDVTRDRDPVVRAAWNALLERDRDAVVELPSEPSIFDAATTDASVLVDRAIAARPELLRAGLTAERADLAVRMAETMTLPRLDLGTSRFEREATGEAGVQRGPVFPPPGRMSMPRSDFGVRAGQLDEMRARATAAHDMFAMARAELPARVQRAHYELGSASARRELHVDRLLPLAARARESARSSFESGRATYVELLEAERAELSARLGLTDADRDVAHAWAALTEVVGELPDTRR